MESPAAGSPRPLTDDEVRRFAESGWVVLPGWLDPAVLGGADAEVDRLLAEAPPPAGHVGPHFYWRPAAGSPALSSPRGSKRDPRRRRGPRR